MTDFQQPPPAEVAARMDLAATLSDAAGELLMSYFESGRCVTEHKRDGTPVTDADRGAETLIRGAISEHFGRDGLLGEEHGTKAGDSGFTWVIDPIDGTMSFIHGVPVFGSLIGIEYGGRPVAGVMDFPALGERAWASLGQGAWHTVGGKPPARAGVSDTSHLEQAMVCTTSYDYYRGFPWEEAYVAVARAAKHTRGWSDCHSELLLVTGRIDAVVEPVLNPWDISAIIAVLQEAGGRFTDWRGGNSGISSVSPGVCSNGPLHDELVHLLSPWAP
jgi:histidinol phosphatase-like enzyme (inositol monophosphatase family)